MKSLVEERKLENILKEIERMKVNILAVNDTQRRESANFITKYITQVIMNQDIGMVLPS